MRRLHSSLSAVETFDVDLEDGDSSSHRISVDDDADSAVDDNADSATGHCWHDDSSSSSSSRTYANSNSLLL